MADPLLSHLPRGRFLLKPLRSWLMIGAFGLYIAVCGVIFTLSVQPIYGLSVYLVAADSDTYFSAAGLDQDKVGSEPEQYSDLVGLGGSVVGPVIIATIGRNRYGVAVINCLLFLLTIQVAAAVPGLSRRVFAGLLMLNALTVPALITLNKEILAIAGLAFFAKYLYSKKRPLWLLGVIVILSTMARWQQTAFIFIYLVMEWRHSPLRQRPKTAIAALILFVSAAWAVIAWRFGGLIAAYASLQGEITSGTISRLNAIQSKGGFFLVVWPKILMNVSGRLVQVQYFAHEWIESDFHDLQNTVIGNLHSIAMLLMLGVMVATGRFRLARPLVYFTFIYLILTSVSPLIQNRYEYPAYALLAMEMARKKESLEPVEPFWVPPRVPNSYLQVPSEAK
jgi:hypothetical protein